MLSDTPALVSMLAGQDYSVFRPVGYSSLEHLDFGRGPEPYEFAVHLTKVRVQSDLCEGLNDVLAVTLPAPVVGNISPEDFCVHVCQVEGDHDQEYFETFRELGQQLAGDNCERITPACARLQLEDEPHERRTVLLHGQFVQFHGKRAVYSANQVDLRSVTFLVDGKETERYGSWDSGGSFGRGVSSEPTAPVHYGQGPFLADISLLNLSAPLNTAAADPHGCAALHPSATYAVRLLFASAVHERAGDGGLAPFGTHATAAAGLFSVRTGIDGDGPSPDQVVGVAAVPGGSAVDVCIEAAAGEPQVEAVVIDCTAAAPLSPAGFPCTTPIKAFLRSEEDQRAGRDPATFAGGHNIEFCLSVKGACTNWRDDAGARERTSVRNALAGAGVVLAAVVVLAGLGLVA